MNLDLTGLAEVTVPAAGEPLLVRLDAISCDPNQPRRHIDEAALQELAESIRVIGVVQPISVRPDPAASGRYIINYGERRYRASLLAGVADIPAFLHKSPDDYEQVAENLHRSDLSPMEMALFIKRRLDAGDKKNEIAARLGYKNGYVTEHLALLEAPPCVEKAYANGATSARTLYDLRRLHDEFPREVEDWCASGVDVTRDTVAALVQKFRRDEISGNGRQDPMPPVPGTAHETQAPPAAKHEAAADASAGRSIPSTSPRNGSPARSAGRASLPAGRLLIKVEHGGRKATVQDDSIVVICYDDGGIAEVRLAETAVLGTAAA